MDPKPLKKVLSRIKGQADKLQEAKTMVEYTDEEIFIAKIRFLCWCSYQMGAGQEYNVMPNKDQWDSLLAGVRAAKELGPITPEKSHELWMKTKTEQGWKYGPVKNFLEKTHPDLVPYEFLPAVEQRKDAMGLMAQYSAEAIWKEMHQPKLVDDAPRCPNCKEKVVHKTEHIVEPVFENEGWKYTCKKA